MEGREQRHASDVDIGSIKTDVALLKNDTARFDKDWREFKTDTNDRFREAAKNLGETNAKLSVIVDLLREWGGIRKALIWTGSALLFMGGAIWAMLSWAIHEFWPHAGAS